jgi:hypothetical protein
MAIRLISPERLLEIQAEGAEEIAAAATPTLRNVGLALNLDGDDVLHWRGREYAVPPVPWDEGVRLLDIQTKLQRLTQRPDAELSEYRLLMRQCVRLFPRLIRRRFAWLRPNPFRRASGQEIGSLLGFFSACQMKPPAGTQSGTPGGSRPHSTSRTGSRSSSADSRRGR